MEVSESDWKGMSDLVQLDRIEVTVSKVYSEPESPNEYKVYTVYSILPRTEVHQADIIASDLDIAIAEAMKGFQEVLDKLHAKRRVHLDNMLQYGK